MMRGLRSLPAASRSCMHARHQPPALSGFLQGRSRLLPWRRTLVSTKPQEPPSAYKYPERILVYHAGLPKIWIVACTKLTTVFLAIIGSYFGSWLILSAHEHPVWLGPLVVIGGAVPLLAVGFVASPFVAFVFLRPPPAARTSTELLARWAAHLPASTEVRFTTLGLIGMRRGYQAPFATLRRPEAQPFWSIANLVVTGTTRKKATGLVPWIRRQQGQFFVGEQRRSGVEAEVWKQAWAKIPKS